MIESQVEKVERYRSFLLALSWGKVSHRGVYAYYRVIHCNLVWIGLSEATLLRFRVYVPLSVLGSL
jgi:hypothetical protein